MRLNVCLKRNENILRKFTGRNYSLEIWYSELFSALCVCSVMLGSLIHAFIQHWEASVASLTRLTAGGGRLKLLKALRLVARILCEWTVGWNSSFWLHFLACCHGHIQPRKPTAAPTNNSAWLIIGRRQPTHCFPFLHIHWISVDEVRAKRLLFCGVSRCDRTWSIWCLRLNSERTRRLSPNMKRKLKVSEICRILPRLPLCFCWIGYNVYAGAQVVQTQSHMPRKTLLIWLCEETMLALLHMWQCVQTEW